MRIANSLHHPSYFVLNFNLVVQIQGDKTLREFLDYFSTEHNIEVTMLSCGVSMLFSFFMPAAKSKERMGQTMQKIVADVQKREIEPHEKYLIFEIVCDDENGDDVEVPFVTYKLPK